MTLIEQAEIELKAANFGEEDSKVMIDILKMFFGQWDSGGAVSFAQPVLMRLIAGKPLGPLTGADGEWHDPGESFDCLQNVRCSTVFKHKITGKCTDIDVHPDAPITFPYDIDQRDAMVKPPVYEVKSVDHHRV